MDGSQRRVSPQARGGGTGGHEVRSEQVSLVNRAAGELPGAKRKSGCVAGSMTAEVAGAWQESGGQGQAVAQQLSVDWQQAAAHSATETGCTAAGASGAAAREASRARRAAAFTGFKDSAGGGDVNERANERPLPGTAIDVRSAGPADPTD
jgi:hypothetical protein